MSARIRVAVIGVGHMGTFHARLWRQCEAVEMVGVYDIVPDRARAVAEELGGDGV
jgi:predicted dehydrogenase